MTPERRYALDALLDALGLPFDESVWVPEPQLDEVFALLTLAHEREAELDRHGRPLPPAEPPGPRVAEIAAGLGLERRDYPGGERFLVALTHDVDLLGGGGFRTAARKLGGAAYHRSGRRLREGLTFAVDAWAWRDPDYPIDAMLDADAAYEAAVEALEPVAEHGGAVAILWHPPQHHPRLANGFDRVYRRLLAWIDERGGWAGPAAETLDRWEGRRG